eukprot:2334520-Prorocentrum_lima.AAC.1
MPRLAAYYEKREKGIAHVVVCMQVYESSQDRMFLHEHAIAAWSWQLAEVQNVAQLECVDVVVGDQC